MYENHDRDYDHEPWFSGGGSGEGWNEMNNGGHLGKKSRDEVSSLIEEDEDDGNSSDEGYATNSGTGNSPYPGMEEKESSPGSSLISPSPSSSSTSTTKRLSGTSEEDEGNPNLMWLLDFKLDFFNDQPGITPPLPEASVLTKVTEKYPEITTHEPSPKETKEEPSKNEEVESGDIVPRDSSPVKGYEKSYKKPPYTYTELITQALKDKTALTVSGIYQWIMDRYLFFKAEDDRWKNSVRHNLSMNPHFRKGTKSKHGAGHLWVLADYEEDSCLSAEANDVDGGSLTLEEDEATKAVKSILDSEEQKLAAAAQDSPHSPPSSSPSAEESVKKGKRKRKYPVSPLETYSQSSNTFQKAETLHSSLLRDNHESFVVQELSAAEVQPGQEVFIAETNSVASLLDHESNKRIFLELSHEQGHHHHQHHPQQQQQQTSHHQHPVPHSNLPTVIHHPNSVIQTHQSVSNIHPSVLPTVASNVEISTQHIPFSPMEDMEELGVSGYCYEEDVTSLENALGFDFHQKQLLAK